MCYLKYLHTVPIEFSPEHICMYQDKLLYALLTAADNKATLKEVVSLVNIILSTHLCIDLHDLQKCYKQQRMRL